MKTRNIVVLIIVFLALGIILGFGFGYIINKINNNKSTQTSINSRDGKDEVSGNIATESAASTITSASLTITPISTSSKTCWDLIVSFDPNRINIGYSDISDTIKNGGINSIVEGNNAIKNLNDSYCKIDSGNKSTLQLFPINTTLPCFACNEMFSYINLYRGTRTYDSKDISSSKDYTTKNGITGKIFEYDKNTTSQAMYVGKTRVFTFKHKGVDYQIELFISNLEKFGLTETYAQSDYQLILDDLQII